jgi:hypothetical protein
MADGQPVPGMLSAPGLPDPQHLASPHDDGQHLASPYDDRHAGFRSHDCDRCGAAVLVAKFSPQHTSVQWSPASVHACAEFTARLAGGEQTALIDTCASLRGSIERAVSEGRLQVTTP